MKYVAFGAAGAASTTAATAGIIKVDMGSTLTTPRIFEFSIGPGANSADNTYTVRAKRQSTAGTWTGVTPSPLDTHAGAANSTAGVASTAAGTAGVELGRWGFHMRNGYRWVSVPGGEFVVALAANNGIIWEYIFTQGTDVLEATVYFDE